MSFRTEEAKAEGHKPHKGARVPPYSYEGLPGERRDKARRKNPTWQLYSCVAERPWVTEIGLEEVNVGLTDHNLLAVFLVVHHFHHQGLCMGVLQRHELQAQRGACEVPQEEESVQPLPGASYHSEEEGRRREVGILLEVADGFCPQGLFPTFQEELGVTHVGHVPKAPGHHLSEPGQGADSTS